MILKNTRNFTDVQIIHDVNTVERWMDVNKDVSLKEFLVDNETVEMVTNIAGKVQDDSVSGNEDKILAAKVFL